MPSWVTSAVSEYQKRLPANFKLIVTEVPLGRRSRSSQDIEKLCREEGEALLKAASGEEFIVALDVKGKSLATVQMAGKLATVRDNGQDVVLLVGGPDGLSAECLGSANEIWSLSALTLPHTIVRIVVAEQIYRVWSVLAGHPYHRE